MRNMFFTDDNGNKYPEWKEKKLREVLNLHYGKDQKGYIDPKGEYPILGTGGEIGRTNTPLFNGPSVLIGRKGTIDKPRFMDTPFRTVDTLFYTSMKMNVSAKFIYQFAKTVKWRNLSEATGVPSLNSDIILNIPIALPSFPEQEKIASFFSALDENIDLHANKVALLKEQKKGYLQKIFSRELVFTDDNGDSYSEWEEKKLGSLYQMASGMPFRGEEYQDGGEYSVVTNTNVQGNRYLDMSSASRISAPPERIKPHQILKKGNILISLDGNVGRVSMVKEGKLLLAQRVGLLQPKSSQVLDNDFLYICLANDKFKDEMLSKQQGGGLKHIYARDVEGFGISVPSLDEQQKIGSFFSDLDENIELNENKLDLLEEQKKGYLQSIFGM